MLCLQEETGMPLPGMSKNEQLSTELVFFPGDVGGFDGKPGQLYDHYGGNDMLTRQEIEEKVWEILDNLGVVDKDGEETVIHSEEIDSVQLVSIIVEIEENFDVEISDEYMNPEFLLSFDHIVDVVEDLLNNSDAAPSKANTDAAIADTQGDDNP